MATFALIGIIFYMMINKYYEYAYVQAHVSDDLPMRYIFSAFWEGQEGSFLLWMFWHIVLGFILIRKAGEWEAPVMIFIGLIQAIMASMLLGIHIEIGDFVYRLGSNPVLLLRDSMDIPLFEKADYVSLLTGTGLNVLLQNYWMTIHPPTLFLGFASSVVPFAYAAGGFYAGRSTEWLKPALRWALFSGGILGVGILMGSAWAYEALSFGGYWAWDPVENMSLVPWIIMVAGIHTNLIAQATGRAIKSTYIYYAISFVGVLYSTYLTRSGILGDTSAHAFTEMGLEPQLIFMVLFSALVAAVVYLKSSKVIPKFKSEESIYSREFWMFIGALVLLFSGVIIGGSTSLPVLNAIMRINDPEFVGTVISEPIPHYNKFQIWIAILIMVLSAKTVFLRYKSKALTKKKTMSLAMTQVSYALIAVVLTFILSLWLDYFHWKYVLLAFASCYTVVANSAYLVSLTKASPRMAAAAVSHIGFGIMVIGIIASGLNEKTLTTNPFAMKGILKDKDLASVVTLIKDEPFFVNDYWITYQGDTIVDKTRTFKIQFEREDSLKGNVDPFHVYPNVMYTKDYSKIATTNPDAKHFLSGDIFTTVASLPKAQMDVKFAKEEEDSLSYVPYTLQLRDTLFLTESYGILESISFDPTHPDYLAHENDLGISAKIRFKNLKGDVDEVAEPAIGVRENHLYQYHAQLNDLKVKIKLNEQSFDNFFSTEERLDYVSYQVPLGGNIDFEGRRYTLLRFEKIDNPNYKHQENDIPIQAVLSSESGDLLKPVYVIRDGRPFNLKDYEPTQGVHIRLVNIDPDKELFTFALARDDRSTQEIVIDLAEDVTRTDVIVLEALIFPGINLFWAGSILMLLGFFLALINKRRSSHG